MGLYEGTLSKRDAAAMMGISYYALKQLIKAKRLRLVTVIGTRRVTIESIKKLQAELGQEIKGGGQPA